MTDKKATTTKTIRMEDVIHEIAKESAWRNKMSIQRYIEALVIKDKSFT